MMCNQMLISTVALESLEPALPMFCRLACLQSGNSWGPLRLDVTSGIIRHHGEDAGQVKTCEMNTLLVKDGKDWVL